MRPWRIGMSSGTRWVAWSARIATGSWRPAGGSQSAWLDRGVSARAARPRAARSSAVAWGCRGRLAARSGVSAVALTVSSSAGDAGLGRGQQGVELVLRAARQHEDRAARLRRDLP